MIFNKRGQGKGKWNVPGGKIGNNESIAQAAERETAEETGIRATDFRAIGRLEFIFARNDNNDFWSNDCTVLATESWRGKILGETDECLSRWVSIEEIPYDEMWEDDRQWFPLALAAEPFHHRYHFDASGRLTKSEVIEQDSL